MVDSVTSQEQVLSLSQGPFCVDFLYFLTVTVTLWVFSFVYLFRGQLHLRLLCAGVRACVSVFMLDL